MGRETRMLGMAEVVLGVFGKEGKGGGVLYGVRVWFY